MSCAWGRGLTAAIIWRDHDVKYVYTPRRYSASAGASMEGPFEPLRRDTTQYGNPHHWHSDFVQNSTLSAYGNPRQNSQADRPMLQGVDALFQDYRGGSRGPLEFDFGGAYKLCVGVAVWPIHMCTKAKEDLDSYLKTTRRESGLL